MEVLVSHLRASSAFSTRAMTKKMVIKEPNRFDCRDRSSLRLRCCRLVKDAKHRIYWKLPLLEFSNRSSHLVFWRSLPYS